MPRDVERSALSRRHRRSTTLLAAILVGVGALTGPSGASADLPPVAGTVTSVRGAEPATSPTSLAVGPDGALWFTEGGSERLGRTTTAGVTTHLELATGTVAQGIVRGGAHLYAVDVVHHELLRLTPPDIVRRTALPAGVTSVVPDPDGTLWGDGDASLIHIAADGTTTTRPVAGAQEDAHLTPVAVTAQGIWTKADNWPDPDDPFPFGNATAILRVDPATGAVPVVVSGEERVPLDATGFLASPRGSLTATDDGALWFSSFIWATDHDASVIGRIAPDGTTTKTAGSGELVAEPGGSMLIYRDQDGVRRISSTMSVTPIAGTAPGQYIFNRVVDGVIGPDGALWLASRQSYTFAGGLRRIVLAPVGSYSEVPTQTTPVDYPTKVVKGPEGALYAVLTGSGQIGRLDAQGHIVQRFTPPPMDDQCSITSQKTPQDLVAGPDGALWMTFSNGCWLGRLTPSGSFSTVNVYKSFLTGSGQTSYLAFPSDLAVAPDGALWYTAPGSNAIGRYKPGGTPQAWSTGQQNGTNPRGIVVGDDGVAWFGFGNQGGLASITTTGTVANHSVASAGMTYVSRLVKASDGTIFVTDGSTVARLQGDGTPAKVGQLSGASNMTLLAGGSFVSFMGNAFWVLNQDGTSSYAPVDYLDTVEDRLLFAPSGIVQDGDGHVWAASPDLGRFYRLAFGSTTPPPSDTVTPSITIDVPAEGQHLPQGAAIASVYRCDDGAGSGVQSCDGPAAVDTATAGDHAFTVDAADKAGNTATKIVHYVVDVAPVHGSQDPGGTAGGAGGAGGGQKSDIGGGGTNGGGANGGGAVGATDAATIKALLRNALATPGPGLRIGSLLRVGGITVKVELPAPGTLTVSWYQVSKGARIGRAAKPNVVLVARGRVTAAQRGKASLAIRLTSAGRRLLKHARRAALQSQASFSPKGGKATTMTGRVTLKP
jgi:virginiamycin B lyase